MAWQVKLKGRTTKWILKRALQDLLPGDILHRKKKGFGIPLSRWLRRMPHPTQAIPYADATWLKGRWLDHRSGRRDDRAALWCWIALSQGLRAPA